MPHYPMVVLAPVAGLAVDCLAHLVASRPAGRAGPYRPLAIGAACGLAATIAISVVAMLHDRPSKADGAAFLVMNVVAFLALAFCYFNFVNLAVASLRIRMLEELLDSAGSLPRALLLRRYDSSGVIDLRIDRLLRGGHLVETDGRLRSAKVRFLLVARIFEFLRHMILGRSYRPADRTSPPAGEPRNPP